MEKKVKQNLSLDSWVKYRLERQAADRSRTVSQHVTELVNDEGNRISRRAKYHPPYEKGGSYE